MANSSGIAQSIGDTVPEALKKAVRRALSKGDWECDSWPYFNFYEKLSWSVARLVSHGGEHGPQAKKDWEKMVKELGLNDALDDLSCCF